MWILIQIKPFYGIPMLTKLSNSNTLSVLLQIHRQPQIHCQFYCKCVGNLQSMIKMWHECMVKLKYKCIIKPIHCQMQIHHQHYQIQTHVNASSTIFKCNVWSVWSTEYHQMKFLWPIQPSLVSPVSLWVGTPGEGVSRSYTVRLKCNQCVLCAMVNFAKR